MTTLLFTNAASEEIEAIRERLKAVQKEKRMEIYAKTDHIINPYLRWTIFATNVSFWVFGVCLMLVGIWAFIQKTQTLKVKEVKHAMDVATDLAIVFAFIGFIVFAITLSGCYGVLRLSVSILNSYRWSLLALLLLQTALVVGTAVFTSVTLDHLKTFLVATAIKHYRDDIDLQNLVDWTQTYLECCGIGEEGYKDWNSNMYFNCTDTNPSTEKCSVPYTCCISPNDIDQTIVNTRCGWNIMKMDPVEATILVWPRGCLIKVNINVKNNAIYFLVGYCVYLVGYLMVISAVERLIAQIKKYEEVFMEYNKRYSSVDLVDLKDLAERKILDQKTAI